MGDCHDDRKGRWRRRPLTVIGLMSGTSLDGIDAALLTTDGERVTEFGPSRTYPYGEAFRQRLRAALGPGPRAADAELVDALTRLHAEAVADLLDRAALASRDVDVIGFHGHTVWHRPERGETEQIGDGRLLARLTRVTVVNDFRAADVKAGGQGAPLVPLFHAALAGDLVKPVAFVNIGGVANVTWIGERRKGKEEAVLAFDTGPGNALVDDWVRATTGQAFDQDGHLAAAGRVDQTWVAEFLRHPYFQAPPPKSLDRDAFAAALQSLHGSRPEDGAATLTAATVATIAASRSFMPAAPKQWLICGGGRRNPVLMAMLAGALDGRVAAVEAEGWNGDALEAQAFAFLAVRSLRGLPLTLPSTTGVAEPLSGGIRHPFPDIG